MNFLELVQVDYSYNKRDNVLQNISVSFEMGKMYAILGKSGSGKTTLLSVLGGMDLPWSGKLIFAGTEINKKNVDQYRAKHVSIIFQNYNLIDYLTAVENIELITGKEAKEILCKLGLKEEMKRNVLELSGGQQQRVAIGRALASKGEILLADEPTGNLDKKTELEIVEILRRTAHEHKKCVIVVTHSAEVAKYADIVFELKKAELNLKNRRNYEKENFIKCSDSNSHDYRNGYLYREEKGN